MSKSKRKLSVGFKRFLAIVLVLVINTVSYLYFVHNYKDTDEEIREAYQEKLQKYEIVEAVANSCVQEGMPILIPSDSSSGVLYDISNNGNNIHARFWLDEKRGDEYPYSVTFKLSQEFEILESTYPERMDFEGFKRGHQTAEHFLFGANAVIVFLIIYIGAALIYGLFGLTRYFFKLFKREKKIEEPEPQAKDSN